MKKAFTIMETVIAVLIVSIVGMGVMESGSNYTRLFGNIEKKSLDFERMSAIGLNASEDHKGFTRSLDDFSKKFSIKNDKIIDYLKTVEFKYDETKPRPISSPKETNEEKWDEIKDKDPLKNSSSSAMQFGFVASSVWGKTIDAKILSFRQIVP